MERPFDPTRQRDDAICIGSLVHEGLENWYRHGTLVIRDEVLLECNPSPEAMTLVRELLNGYIQRYPVVPWKVEQLEMPLTKHLWDNNHLLAKVDQYFSVPGPEPLMVESGIPGERLTLLPGYWIQENKTKAMSIDRAKYMRRWTTNMQADFQLIALREHLRKAGVDAPVHGVLVNVLEKPKEYVPKRKCKNKSCGQQLPMAAYLPHPEGAACPLCGEVQKLSPYNPKTESRAEYYRLITTRSPNQLEISEHQICGVLSQMNDMREFGHEAIAPNKENCVDTIFGDCEYYKNHTYGIPVEEDDELRPRDATKYVELFKIREAA
jgi:hypothetical protein